MVAMGICLWVCVDGREFEDANRLRSSRAVDRTPVTFGGGDV